MTITVSDGISMGHEGMRASLPSREVIADSIELVVHAERFDGVVTIARLRQVFARACSWRLARLNLSSVLPLRRLDPSGTVQRRRRDHRQTCSRVSDAVAAGLMTEEELGELERVACPGAGACAGMFTANTMSSISEALGMALP